LIRALTVGPSAQCWQTAGGPHVLGDAGELRRQLWQEGHACLFALSCS